MLLFRFGRHIVSTWATNGSTVNASVAHRRQAIPMSLPTNWIKVNNQSNDALVQAKGRLANQVAVVFGGYRLIKLVGFE